MGICREEVKEKIEKFENSRENIESKIGDVEDKLEEINNNFTYIIQQKDLGENMEKLKSRVNNITNKMNLFVQNVLMVKNTQNMVNDIQKRVDFLEKQRLVKWLKTLALYIFLYTVYVCDIQSFKYTSNRREPVLFMWGGVQAAGGGCWDTAEVISPQPRYPGGGQGGGHQQ